MKVTVYWVSVDFANEGPDTNLFATAAEQEEFLRDILIAQWGDEETDGKMPSDTFEGLESLKNGPWGDENYLYWDEQEIEVAA
jgi:hypothetical protein